MPNSDHFFAICLHRFPSEVRDWLTERTGKTSVPQIFFNARHVGGNEELQRLVADQDLWRQQIR